MNPIPEIHDPERYTESSFADSEFVKLENDDCFDICMQYPILGMDNAECDCFVRIEVYELLKKAAGNLPNGYRFRILDAWRPFALQKELYEDYSLAITDQFGLAEKTEADRNAFIRKFVSDPVYDKDVPPVHTTGGAVDITIIGPDGNGLDMGSGFDEFSDRTYTAFYEASDNENIKNNRRLLYNIMTGAGFTNLPSEWWHYDYGDRFWAYYNKRPALYRGVFTRNEIMVKM